MTRPKDKSKLVSKVNTAPTGLQNLLGNVNQGINPHELDHRISPGLDLYPFLATRKLTTAFVAADIAGTVGQYVPIEVPDGELWQVVAASCSYDVVTNHADDTSISIGILAPNLAHFVAFNTESFVNQPGTAGSNQTAGCSFGERFILSGGWNIVGLVNGSAQATVREMTVCALYHKLTE